jgi:CPA2 family monovalent cation:H+ antiporter-2
MAEGFSLVRDFAIVLIVAGGVMLLFRLLRQPPVLGYLIAGFVVGPYTLPTPPVHDVETIRLLADLGIVFLMFGLGLEFSWRKLRQVGGVALMVGSLEIVLMLVLGYQLGRLLGWSSLDSIFLGAALSISSSAIIVKVLRDEGILHALSSRIIVGILVVEDFAAVTLLALLSGVATAGEMNLTEAGFLILKLIIFGASSLALGASLVPRLLEFTARFHSREALLIISVALCFAMALFSQSLGLSVAAGAFLMGAIIAESRHSPQIADIIAPVRDVFAAVFFVSIGMLIDIRLFQAFLVPALAVSAVFILGKVAGNTLGSFITGHDGKTCLRVGATMTQSGEFSLFIAKVGRDLNVVGPLLYPVMVMTTVITALTMPHFLRSSDAMTQRLTRFTPRPIQEYLSYLGDWMRTLRATLTWREETAGELRHSLRLILINLLIMGFFFGGGAFLLQFSEQLAQAIRLPVNFLGLLLGFIVLTFCLPPLVVIWRSLRVFVDNAVAQMLLSQPSTSILGGEVVRQVFRDSVMLLILLAIGVPSIPLIAQLFSLESFTLLIPLLILAAMVYLFWDSVRKLHCQLQTLFSHTLLGDASVAGQYCPPEEDTSLKSKESSSPPESQSGEKT